MPRNFVGTNKTVITVDSLHDLSAATLLELRVEKPDGTLVTWPGTLAGVGNTKAQYIATPDDLDQAGDYKVMLYIESPDWDGPGDVAVFSLDEWFTL